tara:strand:- start:2130 stop:2609 length:480 start_codon:yes stop_codon:yes gene_type:complete
MKKYKSASERKKERDSLTNKGNFRMNDLIKLILSKKTIALTFVLLMSFVGMISSFWLITNTSITNTSVSSQTQWYNLFIPYESLRHNYIRDKYDLLTDGWVDAEINRGLIEIRPYVLIVTFIFFISGLYIAYMYYYKLSSLGYLWLLLILLLLLFLEII